MISVETASQFLDFGKRIGEGQRAREQLKGAVAIHNILWERGVAYLADEVGMGKTYVALGALALFRRYQPNFRVLVLAPRGNIQAKWMKEFRNFINHNIRFPDLRVKSLDGYSTKPMVSCGNLRELTREATLNPDRDFFARLTSFSLPLAGKSTVDAQTANSLRDELRKSLPWLDEEIFDRRNREGFKDHIAMAICCSLPVFDLVIVDEGHNLKYGFKSQAARNRLLGLTMGRTDGTIDTTLFPGYGLRAKRVLFLSATPVEESYTQLWNQLDLFGKGGSFRGLKDDTLDEEKKKDIAKQFLIRRVTALTLNGKTHTKNLYRREWRRGGVLVYDEPIRIQDPKQKLVVALVQKKVSELLQDERFKSSFQIGMLASFESFLQTAKVKDEEEPVFDDADQTDAEDEREGLDVAKVNQLAINYRRRFGTELPHPKMDALVDALQDVWKTGEKHLIFVRRVASVKEIKRKLDERYDTWIQGRLSIELPHLRKDLDKVFEQYRQDRLVNEIQWKKSLDKKEILNLGSKPELGILKGDRKSEEKDSHDLGGNGNFFEWFFRGDGPEGVISGANIQQRFTQRGTTYATFFEQNHVAELLGCNAEETKAALCTMLNVEDTVLESELQIRAAKFLSAKARKHPRADRFEAAQAAALEWLKDVPNPLQEKASIVFNERFLTSKRTSPAAKAPDCSPFLNTVTFFTELSKHPLLREKIWPHSKNQKFDIAFREGFLRACLLATAARLGHAFIDLYLMAAGRLENLRHRTQESGDEDGETMEKARIEDYLTRLEKQMESAGDEKSIWGAFDELSQISEHYDLILDVNAHEIEGQPLSKSVRTFATLLSEQQPIGGMSGQVNRTLVRQFRMPGYPFVLVTTDLLQEGEDLHSFCSSIHHYGVSWTPSSMEQRIGRIDRVRSQTERRLIAKNNAPIAGADWLQVYYPYLEDTIEILQVQKVLERMNNFLKLMHEGILNDQVEDKKVDADKEFANGRRLIPPILGTLVSAFPITPEQLRGSESHLLEGAREIEQVGKNFLALAESNLDGLIIKWEQIRLGHPLLGTVHLESRIQPFLLTLTSLGARPIVRCVSPIGRVNPLEDSDHIQIIANQVEMRLGAVAGQEIKTYDLTVEGDVLLTPYLDCNVHRVAELVRRVVLDADRLEQSLLPGHDVELAVFREDLEKDILRGT